MKFRCRMTDAVAMRDFTNIVNVISRMSKQSIIRFTPDRIYFHIGEDRLPSVWAELIQNHFFIEYILSGASSERNEIYLQVDTAMLARSVGSLRTTARSVKIKLTNKQQQPCLTFEIELPSLGIESRHCIHDVPVRVVPRKEWSEYQEPNIPDFDISIEMPQLKYARNVVEKMKNMTTWLTIITENSGILTLKIDTDNATVSTLFQGLTIWENSKEDEKITATVDIKKFLAFLAWDSFSNTGSVKCNIIKDRMVNLFLTLGDHLKIQYFISAVID